MMQTDAGLRKIFYLTDLDHLGNPPNLHVGQHLEITNAILNTHPAGDFYYTTEAQLRPASSGLDMTQPHPESSRSYTNGSSTTPGTTTGWPKAGTTQCPSCERHSPAPPRATTTYARNPALTGGSIHDTG